MSNLFKNQEISISPKNQKPDMNLMNMKNGQNNKNMTSINSSTENYSKEI